MGNTSTSGNSRKDSGDGDKAPRKSQSKSTRTLKREASTKDTGKEEGATSKDPKLEEMPIVDAIVISDDEASRELIRAELRRNWARDELYSPQWLLAMVKKHNLVDDRSMQVLIEYEYDVHLVKKYGAAKLEELGVSETSRNNLVLLASMM